MRFSTVILLLLIAPAPRIAAGEPPIAGTWVFIKEQSTDLATWRYRVPQVVIGQTGNTVTILHRWMEGNQAVHADSFAFRPGEGTMAIPVQSERWTGNWYMGVLAKAGTARSVRGKWLEQDTALQMESAQTVLISQGETTLTTKWEYRLDPTGGVLTVTEQRSSRPTPVVTVYKRADAK